MSAVTVIAMPKEDDEKIDNGINKMCDVGRMVDIS